MTYIDPRSKTLRHIDRLSAWQRGEKPAPVTVEWDLSNRCSLGCQDCHFAHTHSRGPWTTKARTLPMAFESTGDLADTSLVRRALRQVACAGVRGVVWSGGGEPTLHPDFYPQIVYDAHMAGLEQGLYTLGAHMTPGVAMYVANVFKFVVVSLDAADAQTYSAEKGVSPERFERAVEGIKCMAQVRRVVGDKAAAIGVSFLLHERNYLFAWNMAMLADDLGATYVTFRPAIQFSADRPGVPSADREWITDALPMLRHLSKDHRIELDVDRFMAYRDWQSHGYTECKGIRLNTTITPDGRVWVCPQRRGVAGSCLGDLRTESFASIWARHPGHFTVNDGCRVMCRLHPVNETIAALETPRLHEAFV